MTSPADNCGDLQVSGGLLLSLHALRYLQVQEGDLFVHFRRRYLFVDSLPRVSFMEKYGEIVGTNMMEVVLAYRSTHILPYAAKVSLSSLDGCKGKLR